MEPEPQTENTTGDVVHHDSTAYQSATIAVVDAVAAASETEPTALPPLYETINTDALNALFESQDTRPKQSALCVEFAYNGYTIVVRAGPQVTVQKK